MSARTTFAALTILLSVSTGHAAKYVQVPRCVTTKGTQVGVRVSEDAFKAITSVRGGNKGIVGTTDMSVAFPATSISIDFRDDARTAPILLSKSWPLGNSMPVLMADKVDRMPTDSKLLQVKADIVGPVQLMKVNGQNEVKSATVSITGKLVGNKVSLDETLEELMNDPTTANDISGAIAAKTAEYMAGLVDVELKCEITGFVKK